jgi:hypothetical protein
MKPLRTVSLAMLLAAVLGGVFIVHAMGGSQKVATGTDPYHVTEKRLRAELEKAGVPLRYVHPRNERVPTVSGAVKGNSSHRIGFEYQIFPSGDQATVAYLGRLRTSDFGWPKERLGITLEPKVRGVLGNVAFAEYEWLSHWDHRHYTHKAALRSQLVLQHISRALDDALFNSFPPEDPYANALSTTP